MASLGISDSTAMVDSKKVEMEATSESEVTEELDLTGIDDEEMDSYLLTDAEASAKASMWMTLNGDFLKELEGKSESIDSSLARHSLYIFTWNYYRKEETERGGRRREATER